MRFKNIHLYGHVYDFFFCVICCRTRCLSSCRHSDWVALWWEVVDCCLVEVGLDFCCISPYQTVRCLDTCCNNWHYYSNSDNCDNFEYAEDELLDACPLGRWCRCLRCSDIWDVAQVVRHLVQRVHELWPEAMPWRVRVAALDRPVRLAAP